MSFLGLIAGLMLVGLVFVATRILADEHFRRLNHVEYLIRELETRAKLIADKNATIKACESEIGHLKGEIEHLRETLAIYDTADILPVGTPADDLGEGPKSASRPAREALTDFEVIVYNENVREALKGGERHDSLADGWAEQQYLTVRAADEYEARRKVEHKYPRSSGFVISVLERVSA